MTDRLRPGTPVTVDVYGIPQDGNITSDQPLPRQVAAGRTIPVRLITGQLRFFDRRDVHRRYPPLDRYPKSPPKPL